jgi:hypothetical protein
LERTTGKAPALRDFRKAGAFKVMRYEAEPRNELAATAIALELPTTEYTEHTEVYAHLFSVYSVSSVVPTTLVLTGVGLAFEVCS